MKYLGTAVSGSNTYFSLVENGEVVADELGRLSLSPSFSRPEALTEFESAVRDHLARIGPQWVGLFDANFQPRSYAQAARRAELETIVELAAAHQGFEVERLTLPRIKSLLSLGRRGSVAETADAVFGEDPGLGAYWGAGRNTAALVALAAWRRDAD